MLNPALVWPIKSVNERDSPRTVGHVLVHQYQSHAAVSWDAMTAMKRHDDIHRWAQINSRQFTSLFEHIGQYKNTHKIHKYTKQHGIVALRHDNEMITHLPYNKCDQPQLKFKPRYADEISAEIIYIYFHLLIVLKILSRIISNFGSSLDDYQTINLQPFIFWEKCIIL